MSAFRSSLAIIYAFFTLSNFLATSVVHKLGVRWAMVLGAVSYALFQAGFLYINEPTLYVTSAFLGFGAASKRLLVGNLHFSHLDGTRQIPVAELDRGNR